MSLLTYSLNLNNQLVDLSAPIVMAIINATHDSFFKGNRLMSDNELLQSVEKSIAEGATILDVGGYSTRPMAEEVSESEEIKRVSQAIELILKNFGNQFISVDTYRSEVARHVVGQYKVAMINDIGGGTLDEQMFQTIAELKVAYVLMHIKGNPQTMQLQTEYHDLVAEVMQFLQFRVAKLRQLGVKDIIIDPGFGFAKTTKQNYLLLNKLSYFKELDVPILAGLSRKSMIFKLLETNAEGALNGTTAVNMLALLGGAHILRVHDVKEAVETIRIYQQFSEFD